VLEPGLRLFAEVAPEKRGPGGIREIDVPERENLRRAGVQHVITMREIDERGMRAVMEEALRVTCGRHGRLPRLARHGLDRSEDAPGVGTPVRGGGTYREAHLAMEIVADHDCLLSFEIVEVKPGDRRAQPQADLAVELACSAFGKKILLRFFLQLSQDGEKVHPRRAVFFPNLLCPQ